MKGKYQIDKGGEKVEVEGTIIHDKWGIDKRGPTYYVLTHIPTGYLVWSARTQTFLKTLVQEPEFLKEGEINVKEIGRAIKRVQEQIGWTK